MDTDCGGRYNFSFEVQWNEYQCEARASILKRKSIPNISDVAIESLNVKDDVAITADDLDEETLMFFKDAALKYIVNEKNKLTENA
jgi:hypothetical protein